MPMRWRRPLEPVEIYAIALALLALIMAIALSTLYFGRPS
jgi:hypothetical protein